MSSTATKLLGRKAIVRRASRPAFVLALVAATALVLSIGAPAAPPPMPKIGIVCTSGPSFQLYTTTGNIQTPDSNSIFMWGYSTTQGGFQTPGPVLCVNEGDTVTVTLHNTGLGEPTSLVFPGQDGVSAARGTNGLMTREVPVGGRVTYTFTASHPGTFLYESGTDPSKQVEMGLYGALVVRPSLGANYAYNNASTQFDSSREYLLLLMEIDPDLHHAVETGGPYDFTKVHNRYFAINGREFPDTIQDNGTGLLPDQPYGSLVRLQPTDVGHPEQNALVRILNAGDLNHPFHPHGNHFRQIAQDGRLFSSFTERFGETVGSGQTQDYLLRWDNKSTDTSGAAFNDDWDPNGNKLPVAQPNYRDLTFKDGVTHYSGNPYLGYQGTLPTGTTSLNICGEWYFPLHSHALDEFTNFDEGFGGMATLMRVDPRGGCFTFPSATEIVGGALNRGSPFVSALSVDDTTYYQVLPPTTTLAGALSPGAPPLTTTVAAGFPIGAADASIRPTSKSGFRAVPTASNPIYVKIDSEYLRVVGNASSTNWTVQRGQLGSEAAPHAAGATVSSVFTIASPQGFPGAGSYYVTVDSEILQVTGGQGTNIWTVARAQLGTSAAGHDVGATVRALQTDWFAAFSGVADGAKALKVTYKGKNCGSPTGSSCAPLTTNLPLQTVKICDWTVGGASACSTAFGPGSNGWVVLTGTQSQPVGSTDVTTTWTVPGPDANYVGTGVNSGEVRVLVHTERWSSGSLPGFSTWGNLMRLVYDAP